MSRDPRAPRAPLYVTRPDAYDDGSDDRLAALLPQLEAADALADAVLDALPYMDEDDRLTVERRRNAYIATCDAHLTEGETE